MRLKARYQQCCPRCFVNFNRKKSFFINYKLVIGIGRKRLVYGFSALGFVACRWCRRAEDPAGERDDAARGGEGIYPRAATAAQQALLLRVSGGDPNQHLPRQPTSRALPTAALAVDEGGSGGEGREGGGEVRGGEQEGGVKVRGGCGKVRGGGKGRGVKRVGAGAGVR